MEREISKLPKMAGGSAEQPFVSKSAVRRKMSRHSELHTTLQAIRGVDGLRVPFGSGRAFRNIIKK